MTRSCCTYVRCTFFASVNSGSSVGVGDGVTVAAGVDPPGAASSWHPDSPVPTRARATAPTTHRLFISER